MTTTQSVEILEFEPFKKLFQDNFTQVIKGQTHLFQVNVDKDLLWNTYLNSFPEELRQQFNCNCCRQFIKNYGNLVAIKNNTLFSLWNFNALSNKRDLKALSDNRDSCKTNDSVYQTVIDNLDHLVINATVRDVFVTTFAKLGTDSNIQKLEDNSTIRWHHFYYELPKSLVYKGGFSEATVQNEYRSQKEVFKRSLTEITVEAVETALELAEPKHNVYRLAEFVPIIKAFQKCQQEYANLPENQKDNYCWITSVNQSAALSKIRNSAVGTLLLDLSNEVDINEAVRKFDDVMNPYKYNRKQNITFTSQKQLEQSLNRIVELGYEQSLGRRFATANDLTVNNILWKAGNVKTKSDTSLADSLFNELKEDVVVKPKQFSKLESITIADFIEKIVPKANSIELLLENKHEGNLVSLIAPENLDAPSMFKWDNGFSWSYNKGLADSMKEKVKAAGGKVEGELRNSLEWFNYDDLDIFLIEPNGNKIYYSSPKSSYSSGKLDVDENAGSPKTRTPVENIIYSYGERILEGNYKLGVHNFSKRETRDVGFACEIECQGEVFNFHYSKPLANKHEVIVAEYNYSKASGVTITKSLDSTSAVSSKQLWNINTNKFHKVNMLMYSPNYWDNQTGIGNQHYLFMLDNCKADEARGFFNEFLKQELLPERKVFEALANKMKVVSSDDQLSGVGFSSTQKAEFIVKVTGQFTRTLKVVV